jgi:curved DNA-binding protein
MLSCFANQIDYTPRKYYHGNMKDYYQILGVQPDATPDQIRSAYRKLAVQWHPDRNKDPGAEAKFKEINEAHDILSDNQKRQQHDQERQFGGQPQGFPGGFSFHTNFHGGGDIHDIFEGILRQQGFGAGFGPFGGNRAQRNPDTQIQIIISLEEAYSGKILPVQFTDSTGKSVNITVNVPPGIEHGTRLRYAGNGNRVQPNLPPGDLYVIIAIETHSRFQREGAHLFTTLEVNLWESIAGVEKSIATIEGGMVKISVPSLCKDQTLLRVREKGMPTRADKKMRGDLHVRVQVTMPEKLTDEQRETLAGWMASV